MRRITAADINYLIFSAATITARRHKNIKELEEECEIKTGERVSSKREKKMKEKKERADKFILTHKMSLLTRLMGLRCSKSRI